MGFLLIIYFFSGSVFMEGVSVQHFFHKDICEAAKKAIDQENKSGMTAKCVELKR